MRPYSLTGTRPRKTSASVPRLMPLYNVRTTTSPAAGDGSVSTRISPCPGAAIQNARVSSAIRVNSGILRGGLQFKSFRGQMIDLRWQLPDAPLRASVVTAKAFGLVAVVVLASMIRAGLHLGQLYPLKAGAVF